MQGTDWDCQIDQLSKEYAENEAFKLGFPSGWQSIGEYDRLKQWFLTNCR